MKLWFHISWTGRCGFSPGRGIKAGSILAMAVNYLTTREASQILGVSVRTIQQWTEREWLESWKTSGGHRRISPDSVDKRLIQQQADVGLPEKLPALTVLIIEDDDALRRLYFTHFKSWPCTSTVYTAHNGFDGLIMLGEVKPDLLICDLRLPGVNGFQIVRAVNDMQKLRALDIVVISGLPLPEINAHGGLPERVHVMGKPIDFEKLKKIVLNCSTRKRLGPRSA
jgi:excisionase family DNA binding protein